MSRRNGGYDDGMRLSSREQERLVGGLWISNWIVWGVLFVVAAFAIFGFIVGIIYLCQNPESFNPHGNFTDQQWVNLTITDATPTSLGGYVGNVFMVKELGEGRHTVEWCDFTFTGSGGIAQFALTGSNLLVAGNVTFTSMTTALAPSSKYVPTMVTYYTVGLTTPLVIFHPTAEVLTGDVWANAAAYTIKAGMVSFDRNMAQIV